MSSVSEKTTTIPGPRSQELVQRREKAVARGPFHVTPLFADWARNARVRDVDGNEYIDFAGGIGVMNVGHRPEPVLRRVREQVDKLFHTCFHVMMYEPYVELAERLNALTPGSFEKKTLLVNSGAEAVENAIKMARVYTKRPAVVALEYGFHGRTLLTMSLTGKVKPYKYGFGPFAPEIYHIPYPYYYHADTTLDFETYGERAAAELDKLFKTQVAPDQVAALIVEPVAGEGGFIVPPKSFLQGLQERCKEHDIVFIADEIQTGFGRTGYLLASEHFDLEPDLVLMAKSLANGMPLSAVTGRAEIVDAPGVGGLGGTYGGNPVACAAALGVLDMFEDPGLLDHAREVGRRVAARFAGWKEKLPLVGDARGLGAMQAIELVSDRVTKEPATDESGKAIRYAYEHGLIVMKAGMYNNVIRNLVPLTISDDDLEQGLDILEEAVEFASE